jgi:hypothetical protein
LAPNEDPIADVSNWLLFHEHIYKGTYTFHREDI